MSRQHLHTFQLDLSDDDATPAVDMGDYSTAGVVIATADVDTNVGTFIVEGANVAAGPFVEVPLEPPLDALAGADVTLGAAVAMFPYAFLRVVFADPGASADGTATVTIFKKS